MYIKQFYLYRIMGQLLPVYPVYLLLFRNQGHSLAEISELLIIWSIPGILFEVPSSILADHWNRRNLMVIGKLLKGLCFFIWCIYGNFMGFAAGFILWGTGSALCSGTEEAWLFDALKTHMLEDKFDLIWGKSVYYNQLTVGIASIMGSVIASFNIKLTLLLSMVSILISAISAAVMPEFNIKSEHMLNQNFESYFQTLKAGVSFCLRNIKVTILIGFNVTVLLTAGVLDEYDQIIVRYIGLPLAAVGLWGFIRYGMEALGGRSAWKLKQRICKIKRMDLIPMQFLIAGVAGLFLLLTAGFPFMFILVIYILYYFLMSSGKVLYTDAIQREISSQGRATVQSLSAMLEKPFGILIYTMFGLTGGFSRLREAMASVAVWIFLFCLLFWHLYKKQERRVLHE